jgi:serine/threonine-protein kinase RsbW
MLMIRADSAPAGASRLTIPSDTARLGEVRDFVSAVALRSGCSDRTCTELELAVDEACTNVIRHAYASTPGQTIEISVEWNADSITVTLVDRGSPFDPTSVPAPDIRAAVASGRRGGLGLQIMRMLMDEVEYVSLPGGSNRLRMMKGIAER